MVIEAEMSHNLLSVRQKSGKTVGRGFLAKFKVSRTRSMVTKEETWCPLSLLGDD